MTVASSVDITAIERELRELWKENAAGAGGHAVTRALTLSLVARAHDDETANRISEVAQGLTASHPNRTVLVIVRDNAEPQLEAFVQANCLLAGPGVPQLCGEQVTIDARGAPAGQVASLVLPLLVPDLPVALWLPGPKPFADPLLPRLRGVVNRVIVDSREFVEPGAELAAMAAFALPQQPAHTQGTPAVSDLTWASLTPWRELTAQFFDTKPLLPHLQRIDRVEIDYIPSGQPNPIVGLLAAGWLASRLGWTPLENTVSVEGSTLRLHLRRAAVGVGPNAIRLVTVEIRPVSGATAGASPGLAALRLRAVDGVVADFVVERAEQPGFAATSATVAGLTPVRRLARCEQQTLADLLAAELRLLSRDSTFEAALRAASSFANHL